MVELVPLERACCPFFDFEIRVSRDGGALRWGLTGPQGVKPFIREEFAWLLAREP